jgi:glycosyltransferase involved in cell wall biosynthesis
MSVTAPRRPRIGVDFHTFDGKFQGSRSHLLGLYREAIAMAPDIDFYFLLGEPARLLREEPAFRAPNVRLVEMPHRPALWRLGWQLAQAQRRLGLDLLHVQYRLPFVPMGPCACTIHDVLFETHPEHFPSRMRRFLRWTGQRAVQAAALLYTVSDYSRDAMAQLYGVAPERIEVTTNGVDAVRFRPGHDGLALVRALDLTPGGYVCTVGRIEPRKNHLGLLQAYALLPTPRPPLVIIGQRDPDYDVQAIFDAVQRLGLSEDVRFLEQVSDTQLPALLRHAQLFVYPSLAEGFGMPVLEAMASGVAVITSNTTSLPEVAGQAGLTVDPHNPHELAAAILCLLADPARRAALVQRGLNQAARFHWRASAEVLVGSYRAWLARAGQGVRALAA